MLHIFRIGIRDSHQGVFFRLDFLHNFDTPQSGLLIRFLEMMFLYNLR